MQFACEGSVGFFKQKKKSVLWGFCVTFLSFLTYFSKIIDFHPFFQ